MLLIKSKQVNLNGLEWPTVFALAVATFIYQTHNLDLTITSALDGTHSENSLHYSGRAIDIRIKNVPTDDMKNLIVEELRNSLGDAYDIIVESDHIHIEFDPKIGEKAPQL